MTFFFGIGCPVVVMLIGCWNLMIAILGRFPQFLTTTMGTLVRGTRNIARSRNGRTYQKPDGSLRYITRYAYVYTVRGKQYRYSGSGPQGKSRLLPKMELVYVKWFPRHVYPHKFTGSEEWAVGVMLFLAGLALLFLMLSVMGG